MTRLTRHEAAFVLQISYRWITERLRNMGVSKYGGNISETALGQLGINQRKIDKAFERAKDLDAASLIAACKSCQKLGRACNEHRGMLTFIPQQAKLW